MWAGYSSGVDEPGQSTNQAPVRATPPRSRAPLIFAVVGIVVALAAGGLYLVTRVQAPPRLTPEETIREFLSAVFLAEDTTRIGAVVCATWDPADALARTTKEIEKDTHVSWDEVRVITASDDRVSARARLGLRRADDTKPSIYSQWRFNLVNEKGWRVCEARPFIA